MAATAPIGLLRLAGVTSGLFAIWRFVYGVHQRTAEDTGAVAPRAHVGLLLLQSLFAIVACIALFTTVGRLQCGRPRAALVCVAVAVLALGAIALIFTKGGLSAYGGYES